MLARDAGNFDWNFVCGFVELNRAVDKQKMLNNFLDKKSFIKQPYRAFSNQNQFANFVDRAVLDFHLVLSLIKPELSSNSLSNFQVFFNNLPFSLFSLFTCLIC